MSARPAGNRVLVLVHNLELGGSQINAVDLAAGVREFGFESVVAGPADSRPAGPSLFDVAADRGVPIEEFDRPQSTVRGALDLERLASRHRADLVHVYGSWSIRAPYWGPCLLARRPLVVTVYEMEVDPSVYQATSLIVGTGYLVDDLRGRKGPVRLISPPVDLERDRPGAVSPTGFLAAHGLHPEHFRIVIVSRLDGTPLRPIKSTGVEMAMRAVERLGSSDVDLVVVGTGNEERRLREIGAQVNDHLGRAACVFTGPMADPRAAYAAADVVVGMGGSAARGLAFGAPLVVAGEFGWFRSFTPESATELFRSSFWSEVPQQDPVGELVGLLAPLIADRGERERLRTFGRTFAESNFGLRAMSQRLAEVYEAASTDYRLGDWCSDQRLEARWAMGWLGQRLGATSRIGARARAWSDGVRARGEPTEVVTPGPVEGSP